MSREILIESPPGEMSPLEEHMHPRAVDPHRLGLVLGTVSGGWHLTWSVLVLLGWAQPVIDFIFWLHFITPPYQVGAFVPGRAIGLVAFTATVGYVFGRIIGPVWNALHRARAA